MKKLEEFDFNHRPSRSRYAEAVKALIEDGVFAVELRRGEDFPDDVGMNGVQSGISDEIRKRGKKARTYRVSDDVIVVGLNGDAAPRRRRRRETAAA